MAVTGIIFSNIHDTNIPELTRFRTIGSVPFGCRYRFIDFTLSNMVNSNIYNIDVITHYNYQSLVDHIGSGKDWDLARRSGGIKILPPYIHAYHNVNTRFQTRLEALKSVNYSLSRITDEYVVLSDCDMICNLDLNDILKNHMETGADITVAVKHMKLAPADAVNSIVFESDPEGRITDILPYPKQYDGKGDVGLNILVMKTEYLQQIILDAIAHGHESLTRDVMSRNMQHMQYRVYKYNGYFANITSMEQYYACSMELVQNPAVRDALFHVKNRPVYTKVRNSVPAYYAASSSVKCSLLADGCQIEGNVENSILFRGVKIGKNATVKNCILMQDTIIGDGAYLNHVITDKNAVVRDNRMLSGAETQPYYIQKGKLI